MWGLPSRTTLTRPHRSRWTNGKGSGRMNSKVHVNCRICGYQSWYELSHKPGDMSFRGYGCDHGAKDDKAVSTIVRTRIGEGLSEQDLAFLGEVSECPGWGEHLALAGRPSLLERAFRRVERSVGALVKGY